ncbi:MAG: NAD(P)(+) transhydrogenase (Re/Si-specific) subunit alpha, partial [Kordiimonadaceae bacterium]|nr:NAD(P)(+) transhydrogenase (Re/Si-specific) subunit alpha [Kordiimonadaceae bacterium]
MKLAVIREQRDAEKRVAASPETIKKLTALGFTITVEAGAGAGASIADSAFEEAGATIAPDLKKTVADADVIFSVQGLEGADAGKAKKGALQLAILNPFVDKDRLSDYADAGLMAVAMEFVPRITRAQSMDVLSSQSNLAGYKAVLDAAGEYGRAFPMMMTAAGTIAPAKVMIMGVGVAGLQAIATAKRLGAIVSATDVRPSTKEQVESLGGTFVMVEDEETAAAETSGGYAK